MISKIGYENKTALQNDEDVPETQKVTDQNMNEIKAVVNNNADELEEFQNSYKVVTEKEVSISPIQPLQNQTLWIQRGKNRFNKYGAFDFGIGSDPPTLQEDGTLLANKNMPNGYAKQQRLFLEKNTNYIISGKVISINSNNPDATYKLAVPLVLGYNEDYTDLKVFTYKNISEIGYFEYTINTGEYEYFSISLACNFGQGNSGNVVYDEIMVSKEGGGYEDYVEDKIFIKENNSFSELINIDKLREERYEQLYSGSATTGTILDLPKDLTLFSKLMIKIGNLDVYIPVELFTGKTIFSGTNTNPTADTVELLTLKFNTVSQYNNRIAFSRIAKWVISASGITKDASVNTVTEIWGRR